jgi:hypothetical protein
MCSFIICYMHVTVIICYIHVTVICNNPLHTCNCNNLLHAYSLLLFSILFQTCFQMEASALVSHPRFFPLKLFVLIILWIKMSWHGAMNFRSALFRRLGSKLMKTTRYVNIQVLYPCTQWSKIIKTPGGKCYERYFCQLTQKKWKWAFRTVGRGFESHRGIRFWIFIQCIDFLIEYTSL